jgi:hypothetical protein
VGPPDDQYERFLAEHSTVERLGRYQFVIDGREVD